MVKRARKAFLYGLLSFLSVAVLGAGIGYWRISQGPLSLSFLSGPVEGFINASLHGMRLRVKDVVIERDGETNTVHLRLRRAQLEDDNGQMIARAPRASIGLSGAALLAGEIRPTDLEFIGPRILIKRTLDGEFQLGFGETAAKTDSGEPEVRDVKPSDLKTVDSNDDPDAGPDGFLAYVVQAFAARTSADSPTLDLNSISVTNAAVSIYDEANESFWYAPKTNVVFQRVPYGISVLAHGNVSGKKTPWKLQLAADYISETGRLKVTAKIIDLIPAEMSDLIFALSNLAKVQVPLNGEAHFEFDRTGGLLAAEASLSAGAGLVGFPGFISESVLVDEGTIKLKFEPETGDVVLEDSSIYVGGSRASLNGRFSPERNDSGRLVSWRYNMSARNVSLDTHGTFRDPLAIDSFELSGLAAIEEGRLDIDALRLTAGKSQIELKGTFIEGPEVPAVYLRGSVRNAALPVIKKLWPPEAAPGAREWIVDNVSEDSIVDGDLEVNLTSEALAGALEGAPLPNDQLSFSFKIRNVTTRYFRDMPPITNATADGLLRGNDFEVKLEKGRITLSTGEELKVSNGRFFVQDLSKTGTMGTIDVDVSGTSTAILRLIDHEPLHYAKAAGINPEDLGGNNTTRLRVRLPMLQNVTFDQVQIDAQAKLTDVALASVFEGGDIEAGTMVLNIDKTGLVGKGKVVVNGVKTDLTWHENFEAKKDGTRIEAAGVLSEEARKRLNLDFSSFMRGSVQFAVSSTEQNGDFKRVHVEADLSNAELFFNQLLWSRAAGKGAKASFDVLLPKDGSTVVTNLKLSGPDHLSIQGALTLNSKGELVKVDLADVNLGPGNKFSVKGSKQKDGVMAVRVTADSFDGRPFVDSMFGTEDKPAALTAGTPEKPSKERVSIIAQVKTLFLHNNEHLSNVATTMHSIGGALQRFRMTGRFANAKGIEVTLVPDGSGKRPIKVLSEDAGAALRAVNLYTRAHDGILKMKAVLGPTGSGTVNDGRLGIRDFVVRNEPVLKELGSTTQQASNAPGAPLGDETRFDVLKFKFSVDPTHVRVIDEAIISGPAICSSVRGWIRRADGRLNIAGTLTPACALNSAIGNFPILGPVLMGGEGQGLIGVTFAVTRSLDHPRVTINPVSALAPGFLKRFLEIGVGDAQNDLISPSRPKPQRRTQKQQLR